MTTDGEIFKLRDLHEKFAENPYFSAFSIITPKHDWLCVDMRERDIESLIKSAERKQIFNVVVKDGERILGSINLMDLREERWSEIVKVDNFSIPASLQLFELVDRMVNDSQYLERERSPLYFVYEKENKSGNPAGILTFWDLNRAPVYIFSYTILVYLEHSLLLKIRDSHNTWCDHADLLRKISDQCHRYDNIKNFVKGPKYDYKSLSKWGLPELLTFYNNDPHIERDSRKISENLLNSFTDGWTFRNRIGHTVKLIIEDNPCFKDDLRRLKSIWELGKPAFIDFIDPKVRHSAPFVND